MKAIIVTGQYASDQEVFYPLYRLDEAGYEVDISVKGGRTVLGAAGIKIVPTPGIIMDPDLYDLLILPGGAKCMEYMRQEQPVLDFITAFNASGKTIGCICHGAQLLISADVVRGKHISGYYSIKDDINNAGATFVDAPFVTSGNIVTSPHYKHCGPWMKEVLRVAGKPRGVGEGDFGVE